MARLFIDTPMNLEKTKSRSDYLRRKSTGNSITQPDPLRRSSMGNPSIKANESQSVTPNYLRASMGSCHDFCKYGIQRAFPVKPWHPVGRKLDKNGNAMPLQVTNEDQKGKSILTSPRQHQSHVMVKPESSRTDPFGKQLKKRFSKSGCSTRKDVRTSKASKNHIFPPMNDSVLPISPPEIPSSNGRMNRKKTSKLEIKNRAEKSEREKIEVEEVPEKIIHVIEQNDENPNKDGTQESNNGTKFTILTSNHNQKSGLTAENKKMATRDSRAIIPDKKDMAPKKLKFRRRKVLEIKNGNSGSIDRSLRKLVSEDKFVRLKNDDNTSILRRHQAMEPKEANSVLMNIVIEETASKLVKIRMSKVKALVGAFESVIKIQDS